MRGLLALLGAFCLLMLLVAVFGHVHHGPRTIPAFGIGTVVCFGLSAVGRRPASTGSGRR